MALPVPVRDVKGEPALGQALREAFRRAVDGTGYAKIIGPIEIINDLIVQRLGRFKEIITNNLNVLGGLAGNNADFTGAVSADRLSVAERAIVGELEVFGKTYLNGPVSLSVSAISTDVELAAGKGIILKSPDGTKRVKITLGDDQIINYTDL